MTAIVKSLSLPVQGMTCAGCVSHVEGALKELPGVSGVAVNLATNKASLAYDPNRVTLSDLTRAIAEVGYTVPTAELTLEVSGMTLRAEPQDEARASCVAHVEGALTELDGVTGAVVNLGLGTARVTYIPGVVTATAMKRAVREVGYEAQERNAGERTPSTANGRREKKRSSARVATCSLPASSACW
jgi:Cu+-exporting ATPase